MIMPEPPAARRDAGMLSPRTGGPASAGPTNMIVLRLLLPLLLVAALVSLLTISPSGITTASKFATNKDDTTYT